jgi:hypothetical protein
MEDLEESILKKIEFHIPFFYRFVDDCITCVPEDKVEYVLKEFNAYHKCLQFTIETEENKQISFLDTTLHNIDGEIKTEWYTKKTWSSRYLNYKSCHPISQKKSVIIGLADRAVKLSDTDFRENAIKKAKQALILNNYPITLINKIFKKRINKFYNALQPHRNNKNKDNQAKHISLPFVNGLSQNFQNLFKKYDVTICHKANNLLSANYTKLKSKIPKNKKSNIIYQIPCDNCQSTYIGQTSQYLENRIKSHKYDKKNETALTKHMKSTNHVFNFNNTKIIKTEQNTKKREFLEMIEIQKNPHSVNDKKDTHGLSKIYLSVL